MTIEIKKPIKRQRSDGMAMVVSSHHDDQENPGFLGGYECKTCGKRFKSFQALGGHQGIHRKVKPVDDSFDGCELRLDIVGPNKSFGLHRCKQCMKEFDSGQALGGHMRRHRVEKDLASKQLEEEKIGRRQQAASDEPGKSDLTQEPEEVSRLKAEDDNERREIMKSELILAAREWRLSI